VTTLPEFDVTITTVRSGTHSVRVVAEDAATARRLVQSDCDNDHCHCPAQWCTDDVQSSATDAKLVALDSVTLITAEGVGLGTLYGDDSLHRKMVAHG